MRRRGGRAGASGATRESHGEAPQGQRKAMARLQAKSRNKPDFVGMLYELPPYTVPWLPTTSMQREAEHGATALDVPVDSLQ